MNKDVEDVVIVGGASYIVKDVRLDPSYIQFSLEDFSFQNAMNIFRDVTTLELSKNGSDHPYGIYDNIKFTSALVSANGDITITLSVKSDVVVRIELLEECQSLIEAIVAEVLFGGDME